MEKFIHPAPTEWGEDSIFGCPLAKPEFNIFEVKNQPSSLLKLHIKLHNNYNLCRSHKISSFYFFISIFYYFMSTIFLFGVYLLIIVNSNITFLLVFRMFCNEFY